MKLGVGSNLEQGVYAYYLRSRYIKFLDIGTSFYYSINDSGHRFIERERISKCIGDTSVTF